MGRGVARLLFRDIERVERVVPIRITVAHRVQVLSTVVLRAARARDDMCQDENTPTAMEDARPSSGPDDATGSVAIQAAATEAMRPPKAIGHVGRQARAAAASQEGY